MTTKKSGWITPIGQSARAAAAKRRGTDPEYADLEKKYEVALAIADLVILHRSRAEITQEELASRMGTSISAISRLESGFHIPSMETLRRLAAALGGRVKVDIVGVDSRANGKKGGRPKRAATRGVPAKSKTGGVK